MKRHPSLHALSEEHHNGLIAARDLRLAAEGKRPLEETVREFESAWSGEILPHFRSEEQELLPALACALPADDPLIVRTLTEHVALRRDVAALITSEPQAQPELAARVGAALEAHIRFEERVLFPALETALAGAALEALGEKFPRGGQSCATGYNAAEQWPEPGR